jgi:hypothetical protein
MTHVDEAEYAPSIYSNEIAAQGSNKTPASAAQKTPLAEGYRGKSHMTKDGCENEEDDRDGNGTEEELPKAALLTEDRPRGRR